MTCQVEDEVFKLIEEWERQNDRVFLVGGLAFKSFVRKQKDDWANEKENEKLIKVSVILYSYVDFLAIKIQILVKY